MKKIISSINITEPPVRFTDILRSFIKEGFSKETYVEVFEKEFAKYIGVRHAFAVSSGRYAMQLILKSLNLDRGSEVIVPSYTFHQLPEIIKRIGLKPVFVDIDTTTFNLDPEKVEEKITKNTRVILATHLFGLPCDMSRIKRIAKKYGLYVIEDCAHSLGSEFKGKKVGSIGDAGYFSLGITKQINTFGGGVITTDSDELANKMRREISKMQSSTVGLLRKILAGYIAHFALNTKINYLTLSLYKSNKLKEKIKTLYDRTHGSHSTKELRFTDLQAALGLKQLRKIDNTNIEMSRKVLLYIKLLKNVPGMTISKNFKDRKHSYYNFVVLLNEDASKLAEFLWKNKIFTPIRNDIMQNCTWELPENYAATKKIIQNAIKLPLYQNINDKEIRNIANLIKSFQLQL
ncbi:MAG: DegT/DnrJ/EryC1/StrS family aminotransferase [Candidatus Aenigmarchaeota archaeon]|nr:DegT/DnrJ/EryC1/StrS family aminotransferase [Candidatus Aenigmarchaeota archaeon]